MSEVDDVSRAGLHGLGNVLDRSAPRSSRANPIAIDIETDEIVFFPLIYWPVTAAMRRALAGALAKLDTFMKNGGTIFFDTREDGADLGSAHRRVERRDAGPAPHPRRSSTFPPLEPVPPDHVLTKAFYLLQSFPAATTRASCGSRRARRGRRSASADGVTSIIIGANDYAAAWATDANGRAASCRSRRAASASANSPIAPASTS